MDDIVPNVKTTVRIGDFTLEVYAYRTIIKAEAQLALGMWLKSSKRKKLPKSGIGKVVTIFGFHEG